MGLMTIDFNVNFTLPNTYKNPTCVNIWYGVVAVEDCPSPTNDIVNEYWQRSCGIYAPNQTHTVSLSLSLVDQPALSAQCTYTLKVVVQPCCVLGGNDCNGSYPDTPNSLTAGSYLSQTITINDSSISPCKRVVIGSKPGSGNPPMSPGTLTYTPCYETTNALCNGQTYSDTPVTFTVPDPDANIVDSSDTLSELSNPTLTYLEFCALGGHFEYKNPLGQDYVPGTDYTYQVFGNYVLENTNYGDFERCCHKCQKYVICNNTGINIQFFVQRCNNGRLDIIRVGAGYKEEICVLSLHIWSQTYTFNGNPVNVLYNPNSVQQGAVNIFGPYDCNSNINITCT